MGSTGRRRFRQLTFSRKRAWFYITANEAQVSGTTSSDTSDDSSGEEIPAWREMVESLERGLAKARKR